MENIANSIPNFISYWSLVNASSFVFFIYLKDTDLTKHDIVKFTAQNN